LFPTARFASVMGPIHIIQRVFSLFIFTSKSESVVWCFGHNSQLFSTIDQSVLI
jgi:hypothetical protein